MAEMLRPNAINRNMDGPPLIIDGAWAPFTFTILLLLLVQHLLRQPTQTIVRPLYDVYFNVMRRLLPSPSFNGGTTEASSHTTAVPLSLSLHKTHIHDSKLISTGIPRGLGNWDNSCYQNSILQALAASSVGCFIDQIYMLLGANRDATTTAALKDLFHELNDTTSRGHLWTPLKLKSMSSWHQQDAQEYYSKIMEELETDLKSGLKAHGTDQHTLSLDIGPPGRISLAHSLYTLRRPQAHRSNIEASLQSVRGETTGSPSSPLEGFTAQRVGCTRCGHTEGLSLIPFNCLTLPLGNDCQIQHISDMFDDFTALEHIEGVECTKCTLLKVREQLRQGQDDLSASIQYGEEQCNSSLDQETNGDHRLHRIDKALKEEDFSDGTLRKCHVQGSVRILSTKSRQSIIMQAPQCLVLHINRSLFDETSGEQKKNHADVRYERFLDLSHWTIGRDCAWKADDRFETCEEWQMDPNRSMLAEQKRLPQTANYQYELKAVVMHQGRHEDGHYVCYRQTRPSEQSSVHEYSKCHSSRQGSQGQGGIEGTWWRISDEDVLLVSQSEALSQSAVFMLFYELVHLAEKSSDVAEGTRHIADFTDALPERTTLPITHTQEQPLEGSDDPFVELEGMLPTDNVASMTINESIAIQHGNQFQAYGPRNQDTPVNNHLHQSSHQQSDDTRHSLILKGTNNLVRTGSKQQTT